MTRQAQALRPGTQDNYRSAQRSFLGFCRRNHLDPCDLGPLDVAAFMEVLADQGLTLGTIKNYIWQVNQSVFSSFSWTLTARALSHTIRSAPPHRPAITWDHLEDLVQYASRHPSLTVLKCAVMLAFFAFLRASNLAPKSTKRFDSTRHPCLADVSPDGEDLLFRLRWSKTLQEGVRQVYIPLPSLPGSPVDPKSAWRQYWTDIHASSLELVSPLLRRTGHPSCPPISIRDPRSMFRRAVHGAGLRRHRYTLHSLRTGGAMFAYQSGVPLQEIKRHGTWRSNAVDAYLGENAPLVSNVVACFKSRASSVPV